MALNNCSNVVRVRHTGNATEKLKQAHQMLGLIHDRFADLEHSFQSMSRVQLDSNRLIQYLAAVYIIGVAQTLHASDLWRSADTRGFFS